MMGSYASISVRLVIWTPVIGPKLTRQYSYLDNYSSYGYKIWYDDVFGWYLARPWRSRSKVKITMSKLWFWGILYSVYDVTWRSNVSRVKVKGHIDQGQNNEYVKKMWFLRELALTTAWGTTESVGGIAKFRVPVMGGGGSQMEI